MLSLRLQSLRNQANILMKQEKYPEAIKAYKALAIKMPNSIDIRVNLARCYKKQGKLNEALDVLTVLAELNKGAASNRQDRIYSELADIYLKKGEIEKANTTYEKIRDKQTPQRKIQKVEILIAEKKINEALELSFKLHSENPRDILYFLTYYRTRGLVKKEPAKFDEKPYEAELERVYHKDARIRLSFANTLMMTKNPEQRKKGYLQSEQMAKDFPHHLDIQLFHAICTATYKKDIIKADSLYKNLEKLNPTNWKIFINHARDLHRNFCTHECIYLLNEVLKKFPTETENPSLQFELSEIYCILAWAYSRTQPSQPETSYQYAVTASRVCDSNPNAWATRGHAALGLDKPKKKESNDCFAKAYQLDPVRFQKNHGSQENDHANKTSMPFDLTDYMDKNSRVYIGLDQTTEECSDNDNIPEEKQKAPIPDEKLGFCVLSLDTMMQKHAEEQKQKHKPAPTFEAQTMQQQKHTEKTKRKNKNRKQKAKENQKENQKQNQKPSTTVVNVTPDVLPTALPVAITTAPIQQKKAGGSLYKTLGIFAVTAAATSAALMVYHSDKIWPKI